MRAIWWFPVTLGVLVGALSAGCDVIHEQGNGGSAEGQLQGEPAGAQGDPLPASEHDRGAMMGGPAGHVVTEEGSRTDLVPVGNPSGRLNVLTGIRTDPRGSEEGHLSNEEVGLMDSGYPAPTRAVPFDVASYGMWGTRGPGGMASGSALLAEAPVTARVQINGQPSPTAKKLSGVLSDMDKGQKRMDKLIKASSPSVGESSVDN